MAEPDPETLARAALAFAQEAGAVLLAGRDELRAVSTKSSPTDVVTDMDRASERLLVERIVMSFPQDGILGEEGSEREGTSGRQWVIDPLDGTVNYLYGLPVWAVSIGVEHEGATVAGAVVVPVLAESYVAWTGGGAWRLRGDAQDRLRASAVHDLGSSLIGTGFAYDAAVRARQGRVVARIVPVVRDIRRAGAAAVDLCSVACGALDAYYESGLQPWDLCAGGLIASEAGACMTVVPGARAGTSDMVAAAPGIHAELIELLTEVDGR